MIISDRYRFFPNQVMVEVKDHPIYNSGALCQVCMVKPVSRMVRWTNPFWTGEYNFRYTCDDYSCIDVAKHSFIKEQDGVYNKPV